MLTLAASRLAGSIAYLIFAFSEMRRYSSSAAFGEITIEFCIALSIFLIVISRASSSSNSAVEV